MERRDFVYFHNKRILVIGGTGTIGTSIIKHLLMDDPKEIRILSRDEFKQHQLHEQYAYSEKLTFMIGDVRDYKRLVEAMKGIDFVIHLAAMKRVESCELNPIEAVKTNIIGTYHVMNAAMINKVKKVIFTSSDKAISPSNTYGATKLIAENLLTMSDQNSDNETTVFACVRFGNVMGSRGSVIPLFKEQLLNHQKITITDLKMTRFMMTVKQATELILLALKEAKGGEIFILKMPVVRLEDLANILIDDYCEKHSISRKDVKIELIGLKQGEKMYEELMTIDESKIALELPDMYVIPKGRHQNYQDGKKVVEGSYSSSSQKPLSYEELRELLMKEKLI